MMVHLIYTTKFNFEFKKLRSSVEEFYQLLIKNIKYLNFIKNHFKFKILKL